MKKKSTFGSDLIEAMGQALAHVSGERVDGVRTHHIEVNDVDVRTIRKELKLSQEQMASFLGTSVSGYQKWEQGHRLPSGAARNLLRVMAKEPEAVFRALKVA